MELDKPAYLEKLAVLLFCLIPLALLTGPFIPDLLVSLLVIIFLYLTISRKQYYYYQNDYFFFFLIFYFILSISSINSDYTLFSLQSSLIYIRFVMFGMATWYLLNIDNDLPRKFLIFLSIAFLLAISDGYYQFFFDQSFFGFKNSELSRLSLPLNDRLLLGNYLSRLFPLLIGLLIYRFRLNKYNYIFIAILFISIEVLIYLSGERTAFLIMIIIILFSIFMVSNNKYFRILTLAISLLIIYAATISINSVYDRNISETMSQLGINKDSKRINLFSPQHENYYIAGYKIFLDNKILGSGPNTFRKFCGNEKYRYNESCSTHPHNNYVQLMSEAGLLGIGFFAIIFVFISYYCTKHFIYLNFKKKMIFSNYQICLIATVFCSIFPLIPSMNFFNNWINIVYFLPVGFLLHSFDTQLKEANVIKKLIELKNKNK